MDDPVFDRSAVYEEGDSVVYRASSFGYCIGALVRARLGMTPSVPPDLMLERYQEGHDWEREVLSRGLGVDYVEVTDSRLERFGTIVEGRNGERQVEAEIAWGNKIVRVHPDAIVQRGADKKLFVAEVKFLAEDRLKQMVHTHDHDMLETLGPTYAWQASIEMLATGLPMLYIVGAKKVETTLESRKVVGIGASLELTWDEPAFSLLDVKMRVAEVEGWVARGDMPPCVVPFDYPCGFWQEHEAREVAEVDDAVLVHLVESYARAKANETAHHNEADNIKGDIADRLIDLHLDSGRCAGWDLAWVQPRKGNVSWASWAKEAKKRWPETKELGEDGFRGKEVEGGVRMTKVKGDDDG